MGREQGAYGAGALRRRGGQVRRVVVPAAALARSPRLARAHLRLRRISKEAFGGWATSHSPRWWEYPWVEEMVRVHGSGTRAADFGAGRSPMPIALRDLGYTTTVVDPDTLGGEYDNEWDFTDYARFGIETVRAGIQDAVFEPGTLDVAVSVSVIEHIPAEGRRQGLREIARALRPGGLMVLTVDVHPDGRDLWNFVVDEVEPRDVHGTVDDLVAEAESVGFRLVDRVICPIRLPHLVVEGLVLVSSPTPG